MLKALLTIILLFVIHIDSKPFVPSPPFWGNSLIYYVKVNMTNPGPVAQWQFNYYYNAELDASRFEHFPPQFDEMCQDLPYGSDEQCNVIFATDGWSYIQFPSVDYCCKCENEFGTVRFDWLQENSTYAGISEINGNQCYHWTKQGQYLNHYYCTVEDETPVRFNEMVRGNLKQWDFLMNTYNTTTFDESYVSPPPNCQNMCTSWVCQDYRPPVAIL